MTTKSLRRLASDHASLHSKGLPPNYLFHPGKEDDFSDLTSLSILLAGPEGTAFAAGVYSLELSIPNTYPQSAPTAHFKTKIFHPNVDPSSGAICVETLKRDWKPELTLRDILITINCLLVYPNPASALNAEAGRLVDEDYSEYERKANLWARMHASIPATLREAVDEARRRGNEEPGPSDKKAASKAKARRERKAESDDVFIREDSIQRTPPRPQHHSYDQMEPPLKGLGIDLPESSLNANPETPTQQPAPARRRKAPARQDSAAPPVFAPTSTTAASTTRPLLHSNPSTPRLGRPEPKRRRLTPENEINDLRTQEERSSAQANDEFVQVAAASWLNWQERSPYSSPEDARQVKRRRLAEEDKWNKAGGSLDLWNKGRFGPRLGMDRL